MRRSINVDENGLEVLGLGFYWDDVEPGYRFRTLGRTITEADITLFIGTVGMVEEMFTNLDYVASQSIIGSRPAPGSLVFCMSEGLLMQSTMQRTGMAFMEADIKVHRPTNAGDTIHVECEVIEARATSKPERGVGWPVDIKVHRPTNAGDTIHVECEVIEARATSKPERGLVRTSNRVINQRGEVVLTYNPLRMVKTRP